MAEQSKREVPEQLVFALIAALQSAIHPTLQYGQVTGLLKALSECPKTEAAPDNR